MHNNIALGIQCFFSKQKSEQVQLDPLRLNAKHCALGVKHIFHTVNWAALLVCLQPSPSPARHSSRRGLSPANGPHSIPACCPTRPSGSAAQAVYYLPEYQISESLIIKASTKLPQLIVTPQPCASGHTGVYGRIAGAANLRPGT